MKKNIGVFIVASYLYAFGHSLASDSVFVDSISVLADSLKLDSVTMQGTTKVFNYTGVLNYYLFVPTDVDSLMVNVLFPPGGSGETLIPSRISGDMGKLVSPKTGWKSVKFYCPVFKTIYPNYLVYIKVFSYHGSAIDTLQFFSNETFKLPKPAGIGGFSGTLRTTQAYFTGIVSGPRAITFSWNVPGLRESAAMDIFSLDGSLLGSFALSSSQGSLRWTPPVAARWCFVRLSGDPAVTAEVLPVFIKR